MARDDMGPTSHKSSGETDWQDQDDRVRGRADELEDASSDEDFDDSDDVDEEEEEEGSF